MSCHIAQRSRVSRGKVWKIMGLETSWGPRPPCQMEALPYDGPARCGTWDFPWRQGLQLVSMAVGVTAARKWIKICINSFEP